MTTAVGIPNIFRIVDRKLLKLFHRFLGTDGRNINDIYRFTDQNNRIDIAKLCLESAHIAPTAPDTLGKDLSL